jgi:hypothetical protein
VETRHLFCLGTGDLLTFSPSPFSLAQRSSQPLQARYCSLYNADFAKCILLFVSPFTFLVLSAVNSIVQVVCAVENHQLVT